MIRRFAKGPNQASRSEGPRETSQADIPNSSASRPGRRSRLRAVVEDTRDLRQDFSKHLFDAFNDPADLADAASDAGIRIQLQKNGRLPGPDPIGIEDHVALRPIRIIAVKYAAQNPQAPRRRRRTIANSPPPLIFGVRAPVRAATGLVTAARSGDFARARRSIRLNQNEATLK